MKARRRMHRIGNNLSARTREPHDPSLTLPACAAVAASARSAALATLTRKGEKILTPPRYSAAAFASPADGANSGAAAA